MTEVRKEALDALLVEVSRRDVSAFEEFYDRTCSRAYGIALRVLRNPGFSEETTQEVYLQVWQTAHRFDPAQGSALAWLITLAHRRAIDRVRSELSRTDREIRYGGGAWNIDLDTVHDEATGRDGQRHLVDCLGELTEVQRQSILLAYYNGLTYREVAEHLTISLPAVKSRIRDGLIGLKNCLGSSGDD